MSVKKLSTDGAAVLKHLANDGHDYVAQAFLAACGARVMNGLMAAAPTTASTQVTGTGATTWHINIDKGIVYVNGKVAELAATVDLVIHSGTQLVTNGQSCVAAVAVYVDSSSVAHVVSVKGAAATTNSQVAPTDDAIQAAVDAAAGTSGNPWVKVANCTLNRTGDTTVTQSQDNSVSDRGLKL